MAWFPKTFFSILNNPVGLPFASVSTVVLLMGYISFFFRQRQLAVFFSLLFFTALMASGFEKYPMSGRLLLFIIPILYLLIAEGINRLYLFSSKINQWVSFIVIFLLAGFLTFSPTKIAYQNLLHPNMGYHIKPVISYMSEHETSGDIIYVYYAAIPAFRYYAPFYGFEYRAFITGVQSLEEPDRYLRDIDRLRPHKRVWFIFSNNCSWCKVNEEVFFLEYLDKVGRQIDKFQYSRVSLYLYDLSRDKENQNNDR